MKVKPSPELTARISEQVQRTAQALDTSAERVLAQVESDWTGLLGTLAARAPDQIRPFTLTMVELRGFCGVHKISISELTNFLLTEMGKGLKPSGPVPERKSAPPSEGPRIGVQGRPADFGEGITQRVWEVGHRGISVGASLGRIEEAPSEAIMCPTGPTLGLGEGAVEWAIAEAAGAERFQERMKQALGSDERIGYGEARIVHASGSLLKHGIQKVVLSNVLPEQGGRMSAGDMERFVYHACKIAHDNGVRSISIPAVGTGAANAFGFGMSIQDSMKGFALGVRRFADELGGKTPLKQIDYNLFQTKEATDDEAHRVDEFMQKSGVLDVLLG